MGSQEEMSHASNRLNALSHDSEKPIRATTREKWLQKYAGRMLTVWSQWQTPLGVARAYTDKIRMDLAGFYDDPLKRMFIEASY